MQEWEFSGESGTADGIAAMTVSLKQFLLCLSGRLKAPPENLRRLVRD